MEKDLISIIVPVYKVEEYLEFCLESIRAQTYQNIEIILINDGSPDHCPEICNHYAKMDERICVVHKKNGGLSDARNVGLQKAKGEYVAFIDSDDFVKNDYIESLYTQLQMNNADLVICDYQEVTMNTMEDLEYSKAPIIMNNSQALINTYVPQYHGMEFVTWGKLYKMSLFKDNNICFPVGKIHEDTFTTYKLLYYASKIVFFPKKLYFYRIREGSIMNSGFSEKNLDKLEALEEACEFFSDKNELLLLGYALNAQFVTCETMRKRCLNADRDIKKIICKYYCEGIKKYLINAKMPYLKKIYYKALRIMYL